MNRKIIFSGISVVSALALLAGVTYALIPVTSADNGNTFSVGTPNMIICNDNIGTPLDCGPSIASPINLTDLIPGVPENFTFWLENGSTGPNDTISSLTGQFTTTGGNGRTGVGGTLESDLLVGLNCSTGLTNISQIPGVSSTAFNNWETTQSFGTGTLAPSGTNNSTTQCVMTVELPSSNTTDAGQTLNFNAVYNGSVGASPTPIPTPS